MVDRRVEDDLDARGRVVLGDDDAVERDPVTADGGDLEVVHARLGEHDLRAQRDAVDVVAEVAEPAIPFREAAGLQQSAVLGEEARLEEGPVGGGREAGEVEVGREASGIAAAADDELGVGEARGEPFRRGDDMRRMHGRAAAAEHVRANGVGSDERDAGRRRPVPDGVVLVAAQHDGGLGGDRGDEVAEFRPRVERALRQVEGADPAGEAQDAGHLVVDDALRHVVHRGPRRAGAAPTGRPVRA